MKLVKLINGARGEGGGAGAAYHSSSLHGSHPVAPVSNPGSVEIFSLLLSSWTVETEASYSMDNANAVSVRGQS